MKLKVKNVSSSIMFFKKFINILFLIWILFINVDVYKIPSQNDIYIYTVFIDIFLIASTSQLQSH